MRLGDAPHNGERQTGAAQAATARAVDAKEPIENTLECIGRNTGPAVLDDEPRMARLTRLGKSSGTIFALLGVRARRRC
jgi:hypothetical protein